MKSIHLRLPSTFHPSSYSISLHSPNSKAIFTRNPARPHCCWVFGLSVLPFGILAMQHELRIVVLEYAVWFLGCFRGISSFSDGGCGTGRDNECLWLCSSSRLFWLICVNASFLRNGVIFLLGRPCRLNFTSVTKESYCK